MTSSSAIELKANDAVVYYKQGLIYSNLPKYQEAIKDYNKAIKLNPKMQMLIMTKGFLRMLEVVDEPANEE